MAGMQIMALVLMTKLHKYIAFSAHYVCKLSRLDNGARIRGSAGEGLSMKGPAKKVRNYYERLFHNCYADIILIEHAILL
jgi:hypothetical protein